MHVEAIQKGGSFTWANYFDPPQELLDMFGDAENQEPDWSLIEPEFSK